MTLTAARLRELVRYDPETGFFYWNDRDPSEFKTPQGYGAWRSLCQGKQAGTPTGHGYVRLWMDGANYLAHRLAWLYVYGEWPNEVIDHINGNGCDNRITNLRDVPSGENQRNMKIHVTNRSGVTGVRYVAKYRCWRAGIWDYGRVIHLGSFKSKADAIAARKKAERELGYHPNHGRAD